MARSRSALPAADLARVVVFAAFIAVLGLFPGLNVGGSGVPIVLQNVGPVLAAAVLGWRRGTAATLLLLVLAAIGLPLLSGGRGGIAPFAGPSAGFLIGWILAALVTGLIVARSTRRGLPTMLAASLLGMLGEYVIGVPVLGLFVGGLGAGAVQSLVFVPGDLVKSVLAAVVAMLVHRALPDLLPRRGEPVR